MSADELYIQRCFDLGKGGLGKVSPNPIVGAVIVHQNRIIGEGYHRQYGQSHAEVNAILSVKEEDLPLLKSATLYVSLEPCCIFGKTPPCTNLIIQYKIPRVVISYLDLTPAVFGKGVEQLRNAGVEVIVGVLKSRGFRFNRPRNTFTRLKRPYVILKYAMTADGFLAPASPQQFWITNPIIKRLVHKWRSEIDALLIGTNTAAIDDPQLTNRLYFGNSPLRIVLDQHLRLPSSLQVFDQHHPTLIVTDKTHHTTPGHNLDYLQIDFNDQLLPQLLKTLYDRNQTILMVEGGAQLIQSFLKANLWDEARVLIGGKVLGKGIVAPTLPYLPIKTFKVLNNQVKYIFNQPSFLE